MPSMKTKDWHDLVFKMYFIEYSSRRGINCIMKNVTGRSISRWKTQRKGRYFEKMKK